MKRAVSFFVLILATLLVTVAFTAERTLNSVTLPPTEKRVEAVSLKKKDAFSVLLMGTDQRKGDRGRTDTMVVATVSDTSIQLLSIPRDTLVQIADTETKTKINHAYSYGGTALAVKTVEQFLDIPIDYFVNVNMNGFIQLVDEIGGITVQNEFAFESDESFFPEGSITLTGEEGLKYVRMRYEDPNGDFGRQKRQQQVMRALLDEAVQLEHINDLLAVIRNNVETNLTPTSFLHLQRNYSNARFQIDVLSMQGTDQTMEGIYYYIISEQERQRLSGLLKDHLRVSAT